MNRGYVALWRKSMDTAVFQEPELWKLWCLCLLKANHREGWIGIDGIKKPVKIAPGQFITGRYSLHQDYYPKKRKKNKTAKTIWEWLLILKNMENLDVKTCSKYSIVTIINWHTYQVDKSQNVQVNVQQTCTSRAPRVHLTCTNNNVKNVKNDNNVNKKEKNDLLILPDWLDLKLWAEYKKHRQKLKAPMTDYAEKLALNKLEKFVSQGFSADEIIKQSIDSGWKGFFPLKNNIQNNNSFNPNTGSWQTDANLRAAKAFLERDENE